MNLCVKRIGSLALALLLAAQTLGTAPASAVDAAEEAGEQPRVVADWKFGREYTTGSIADGSLIIEDQSGNDNDLKMQTYGQGNWEDYLSFSDDSMTGQGHQLQDRRRLHHRGRRGHQQRGVHRRIHHGVPLLLPRGLDRG